MDAHASHCRAACLLACWDRSPGAREAAEVWEVLLGKGGKGAPLAMQTYPHKPRKERMEKYGLQS